MKRGRANRDFIRKRAKDFKGEPLEFLRAYCDKLNIWEEGALLIGEKLAEIKESGHLTKELKTILEKVEGEFFKQNWHNIPKHQNYDRNLKKFLRALVASYPHLK